MNEEPRTAAAPRLTRANPTPNLTFTAKPQRERSPEAPQAPGAGEQAQGGGRRNPAGGGQPPQALRIRPHVSRIRGARRGRRPSLGALERGPADQARQARGAADRRAEGCPPRAVHADGPRRRRQHPPPVLLHSGRLRPELDVRVRPAGGVHPGQTVDARRQVRAQRARRRCTPPRRRIRLGSTP